MFVFHKHQTNSNVASFDHILSCERDSTTRKVIFWIYYMFQPNQKTSFIDFQLWQLMLKKKSDVTKCITRTIRPVQIQVEIMDHNICVRGDSVVDLSWSIESVFFFYVLSHEQIIIFWKQGPFILVNEIFKCRARYSFCAAALYKLIACYHGIQKENVTMEYS